MQCQVPNGGTCSHVTTNVRTHADDHVGPGILNFKSKQSTSAGDEYSNEQILEDFADSGRSVRGPHGKSTEVGDSRKVGKIVGNRCQRETPPAFQHVR